MSADHGWEASYGSTGQPEGTRTGTRCGQSCNSCLPCLHIMEGEEEERGRGERKRRREEDIVQIGENM